MGEINRPAGLVMPVMPDACHARYRSALRVVTLGLPLLGRS